MHELALGIVICFGSAEFLYIDAILYIDSSLHSQTALHASASPRLQPLSSSPFEPVDLQAFPTFESFLAQFLVRLSLPPSPPLPEGSELGYWSGSWDRRQVARARH